MNNSSQQINIHQMMYKLKRMFDADDNANRALESFNRGEVPYDEYETERTICDELWTDIKENIKSFSKLSCDNCILQDNCDKPQKELNQFCSSFSVEYTQVPTNKLPMNTVQTIQLTPEQIKSSYNNIKIQTLIFSPECVAIFREAGFRLPVDVADWGDVPFLIIQHDDIIPCYSPKDFHNTNLPELDVSDILNIEIVTPTETNNCESTDTIQITDDIWAFRENLTTVVNLLQTKYPETSIIITKSGVDVIPVTHKIYSPETNL